MCQYLKFNQNRSPRPKSYVVGLNNIERLRNFHFCPEILGLVDDALLLVSIHGARVVGNHVISLQLRLRIIFQAFFILLEKYFIPQVDFPVQIVVEVLVLLFEAFHALNDLFDLVEGFFGPDLHLDAGFIFLFFSAPTVD